MIVTRRSRLARPLLYSALGVALAAASVPARAAEEPAHSAALDDMIIKSAARHGVPEKLVRRIVMRESRYNPKARNHLYWGLMQISYPTAKSMGFRGSPEELLNPLVNLRYAVPYLANAFIIAGKREDAAVRLYASGYYDTAKRRGLLGAMRTASSTPLTGLPDEPEFVATAEPMPQPQPEQSDSIFGGLFGPAQMPRDAQTQQVVYAAAAPQPPQALPGGKTGDAVALVSDKQGVLHPPRKWLHDGGSTEIARGEQSVEQVAAYTKPGAADKESAERGRHVQKSMTFASLDAPAGAQAYAATAGGQDTRLLQADSQAAITQATAGPATPPAAAVATPTAIVADAPVKKEHKRHVARRIRHHETIDTAGNDLPAPGPQAAAGDPEPAAAAPAAAAQTADAGPMPSTQDANAAPQPQAAAEPSPDDAPPTRHKHHPRHAHARKTTAVAAQAPDDGQPAPQTQPVPQ